MSRRYMNGFHVFFESFEILAQHGQVRKYPGLLTLAHSLKVEGNHAGCLL
ncbi:hypothetical protein T10_4570 [Trichinella papuae]|uniref:Uncharacterized protein n=1 Tax=Trichinella papuae TaxID=268474 RepID=A0A0V1N148_9BILA|nr:hypothetical protein T10_4570 [Trichinella papuae]